MREFSLETAYSSLVILYSGGRVHGARIRALIHRGLVQRTLVKVEHERDPRRRTRFRWAKRYQLTDAGRDLVRVVDNMIFYASVSKRDRLGWERSFRSELAHGQ